jgi:hypothetical protein
MSAPCRVGVGLRMGSGDYSWAECVSVSGTRECCALLVADCSGHDADASRRVKAASLSMDACLGALIGLLNGMAYVVRMLC